MLTRASGIETRAESAYLLARVSVPDAGPRHDLRCAVKAGQAEALSFLAQRPDWAAGTHRRPKQRRPEAGAGEKIELENRLSPGEQKINSLTGAGTKDARQNKNKESIWTKDPMVQ
jgi:hypothetical protein